MGRRARGRTERLRARAAQRTFLEATSKIRALREAVSVGGESIFDVFEERERLRAEVEALRSENEALRGGLCDAVDATAMLRSEVERMARLCAAAEEHIAVRDAIVARSEAAMPHMVGGEVA